MIPTSYAYYYENGKLKSFPRYGIAGEDVSLPGEYALFYTEKVGTSSKNDMIAKIFVIRNGGNVIKEFRSSKYGNNPKFLREAVETYIASQLSNPQQTLSISRIKKSVSPKSKRKKITRTSK